MATYSVQHLSFSSIKHRNLLFSAARVFTSTRGVPGDRAVRQLVTSSTQHLEFRVKSSMATLKVHPTAQNGFGAGTNELYDRWVLGYIDVLCIWQNRSTGHVRRTNLSYYRTFAQSSARARRT